MALDIEAMAPEAIAEYRELGERYPTANVLAQADKVVAGLELWAAALAEQGFGAEDHEDVLEARDRLRAQELDTAETASDRKAASQNATDVIADGRRGRRTAITILKNAQRVLRQRGEKTALAAVQSALSQARALNEDSELPKHLSVLLTALQEPTVATAVAGRGGPAAATRLTVLQDAVRAALAQRAGHVPTLAVAEMRDILDGILVTLARNARAAARMAARALGQPAIAAAFELVHLEPPRGRRTTPESPAPEQPAPEQPEQPGGPATPQ